MKIIKPPTNFRLFTSSQIWNAFVKSKQKKNQTKPSKTQLEDLMFLQMFGNAPLRHKGNMNVTSFSLSFKLQISFWFILWIDGLFAAGVH